MDKKKSLRVAMRGIIKNTFKFPKVSAEKRGKKLRREENTKKHHGGDTCQPESMKRVMTM
jgi:hypothetical protein